MASLVPCTICRRHVRRHESHCPFCGSERKPTAGASREGVLARDATRATLIALGLTLAGQACGGKEDEGNDRPNIGIIPPYGIGPALDTGGAGGGGGSGNGVSGSGGAAGASGEGGTYATVPPYGAMPPPDPDGGSGGADAPDSGAPPDAGGDDAGDSDPPNGDAGG
jgi:hypothetical protein